MVPRCSPVLSPATPPSPIRLQVMLTFQQGHLILSTHFLQCSSNLHIWIIDKCAGKLKYKYMHFFYFESINLLFILMEENIVLLKKRIKRQKKETKDRRMGNRNKVFFVCLSHYLQLIVSKLSPGI